MNEPVSFDNYCAICRKKEATQLCDYIIEYNRNPIFFRNYKMFREANLRGHDETCDLPLCKECSHEMNKADLCPHHYELHKQADLPKHLRKAQVRQKKKLYGMH